MRSLTLNMRSDRAIAFIFCRLAITIKKVIECIYGAISVFVKLQNLSSAIAFLFKKIKLTLFI